MFWGIQKHVLTAIHTAVLVQWHYRIYWYLYQGARTYQYLYQGIAGSTSTCIRTLQHQVQVNIRTDDTLMITVRLLACKH